MDTESFVSDVWESVNDGLFTDQNGSIPDDGFCLTIGETWLGALYGTLEDYQGFRTVKHFDTEFAQRDWFMSMYSELTEGVI